MITFVSGLGSACIFFFRRVMGYPEVHMLGSYCRLLKMNGSYDIMERKVKRHGIASGQTNIGLWAKWLLSP